MTKNSKKHKIKFIVVLNDQELLPGFEGYFQKVPYFRCLDVSFEPYYLRMRVLADSKDVHTYYLPHHFVRFVREVSGIQDDIGFKIDVPKRERE